MMRPLLQIGTAMSANVKLVQDLTNIIVIAGTRQTSKQLIEKHTEFNDLAKEVASGFSAAIVGWKSKPLTDKMIVKISEKLSKRNTVIND